MTRQGRPIHFVLRYNDRLRGVDTYREHLTIIERHGSVWWGKFGLGSARSIILRAEAQLRASTPTFVFLVEGATFRYRARLVQIVGGGERQRYRPPTPHLIPSYYRDARLPLWFRLKDLEPVPRETLRSIVLYSNPAVPPDLTTSRGLVYVQVPSLVSTATSSGNCERSSTRSRALTANPGNHRP
jgi:hypothetical protein